MKLVVRTIPIAGLAFVLAGCVTFVGGVDRDLSLPDAKSYTQSMEREIVEAVPNELVESVDQMKTGTFLRCTADGGYQWAGGLTATTLAGVSADEILDPIANHFASEQDVVVSRRSQEEDSLIDIAGHHDSMWILRFDPERAEMHLVSFSPCIFLPEDVWPGDEY